MATEEKALVIFDYIVFAMRGEHVIREAGFKMKTVAPPSAYRTGCDLALAINATDVDAVERVLEDNDVLVMDILFMPKDAKLSPLFLTKLIKVADFGDYRMIRCGNMKIAYRKGIGTVVNISGGGCPDIPYLVLKLVGTVLGEGPRPRALGKTICSYSLEHAYEKALEFHRKGK